MKSKEFRLKETVLPTRTKKMFAKKKKRHFCICQSEFESEYLLQKHYNRFRCNEDDDSFAILECFCQMKFTGYNYFLRHRQECAKYSKTLKKMEEGKRQITFRKCFCKLYILGKKISKNVL